MSSRRCHKQQIVAWLRRTFTPKLTVSLTKADHFPVNIINWTYHRIYHYIVKNTHSMKMYSGDWLLLSCLIEIKNNQYFCMWSHCASVKVKRWTVTEWRHATTTMTSWRCHKLLWLVPNRWRRIKLTATLVVAIHRQISRHYQLIPFVEA